MQVVAHTRTAALSRLRSSATRIFCALRPAHQSTRPEPPRCFSDTDPPQEYCRRCRQRPTRSGRSFEFFYVWGRPHSQLVPGANVLVASNPLPHIVSTALTDAGLEKRGEIKARHDAWRRPSTRGIRRRSVTEPRRPECSAAKAVRRRVLPQGRESGLSRPIRVKPQAFLRQLVRSPSPGRRHVRGRWLNLGRSGRQSVGVQKDPHSSTWLSTQSPTLPA